MPRTKKPLSREEAAKFLGVSTMTLHRKKQAGKIKAVKIGRWFFYMKEDLKELKKEL